MIMCGQDREAFVDATLAELATLSATKLKVHFLRYHSLFDVLCAQHHTVTLLVCSWCACGMVVCVAQVLQDDLARETFKEKLRQGNQQHVEKHKKISAWIATNRAYLQVK